MIHAPMGLCRPALFDLGGPAVRRLGPDCTVDPADSICGDDTLVGSQAAAAPKQPARMPPQLVAEVKAGTVGLDGAITYAIEHITGEGSKKNMYRSILLCGGCAQYRGLAKLLEDRLYNMLPPYLSRAIEEIHVLAHQRGSDPRWLGWKGGSIVARLEAAQDAWILPSEWSDWGLRCVRERSPFSW